jgi:hypothetical protein
MPLSRDHQLAFQQESDRTSPLLRGTKKARKVQHYCGNLRHYPCMDHYILLNGVYFGEKD